MIMKKVINLLSNQQSKEKDQPLECKLERVPKNLNKKNNNKIIKLLFSLYLLKNMKKVK